ncbi:rhizopine catabolism protein [Capsulimonas corticalis]|uniref:Rhizopine catabolism protein n=1 Tax=Capsulimonas corticalis TaxID=2219043 RepID=A0A402CYT9_9BACT|nr:fatty acid desaturase [Capsulimonas corticalis]BDI29635.1 rhizopine catabolism protein [Capsulimonas corticalis]
METHTLPSPPIPRLEDLGLDLLTTSARQRAVALARPLIGVLVYAIAVQFGLWYVTPLIVFWIFVAVVTVTHDVVHGGIGLSARQTDLWLFLLGAVLLESGHAYRLTHHQHHRVFPGPDDPEGDPARLTFWGSVLQGPFFLPKLWLWSLRRTRDRQAQRRWLIAEAGVHIAVIAASLLLWKTAPALLAYVVMVVCGSWVYPLLTVHLPHRDYGETPLTQTRTLRGRIIPAIFLELTYHLEHHLYPQVPSHHLARLVQRLDPFFREAGVEVWRVP